MATIPTMSMHPMAWQQWHDEPSRYVPLTVDAYHEMRRAGIIEESTRFELLHGVIVPKDRSAAGEDPMTISKHHAWAVTQIGFLGPKLRRYGCHMRTQQPVSLPPFDEPEPDGSIVRGTADDYLERHPGATDILCLMEVADSSLRLDRGTKLAIYAKSGIPLYVLINLPDRVIEVYRDPVKAGERYATVVTLHLGDKLELPTASGKPLVVSVRSLLP